MSFCLWILCKLWNFEYFVVFMDCFCLFWSFTLPFCAQNADFSVRKVEKELPKCIFELFVLFCCLACFCPSWQPLTRTNIRPLENVNVENCVFERLVCQCGCAFYVVCRALTPIWLLPTLQLNTCVHRRCLFVFSSSFEKQFVDCPRKYMLVYLSSRLRRVRKKVECFYTLLCADFLRAIRIIYLCLHFALCCLICWTTVCGTSCAFGFH